LGIKRLIEILKPYSIILWETMTDGGTVIHELSKFMIGWDFNCIDAIRRYSGDITGW
jgi:hypothetical protein